MLKTEVTDIGGYSYKVTQLDAVKGRRALTRLAKTVGGGLGGASDEAFAKLAAGLSEADVDYFCDLFAERTEVAGADYGDRRPQLSAVFGQHFADRYFDMVLWLKFCFEVNFRSFFVGLADAARAARVSQKASSSSSPSTSTGTSGA